MPARFKAEAVIVEFCVTPPVVTKVIGALVAVSAALTVTVEAVIASGPPDVTAAASVIAEVLPGEPIRKLLLFAALITPVE